MQSDYQVLVTGDGTGAGIKNAVEGNSDIGMASREVSVDVKSRFGDRFKENLVGYDGIKPAARLSWTGATSLPVICTFAPLAMPSPEHRLL